MKRILIGTIALAALAMLALPAWGQSADCRPVYYSGCDTCCSAPCGGCCPTSCCRPGLFPRLREKLRNCIRRRRGCCATTCNTCCSSCTPCNSCCTTSCRPCLLKRIRNCIASKLHCRRRCQSAPICWQPASSCCCPPPSCSPAPVYYQPGPNCVAPPPPPIATQPTSYQVAPGCSPCNGAGCSTGNCARQAYYRPASTEGTYEGPEWGLAENSSYARR